MIRNYVRPTFDGRLGAENDAIAFWQSRCTTAGNRAEPIQLTNIPQLAKDIHRAAHAARLTLQAANAAKVLADAIVALPFRVVTRSRTVR